MKRLHDRASSSDTWPPSPSPSFSSAVPLPRPLPASLLPSDARTVCVALARAICDKDACAAVRHASEIVCVAQRVSVVAQVCRTRLCAPPVLRVAALTLLASLSPSFPPLAPFCTSPRRCARREDEAVVRVMGEALECVEEATQLALVLALHLASACIARAVSRSVRACTSSAAHALLARDAWSRSPPAELRALLLAVASLIASLPVSAAHAASLHAVWHAPSLLTALAVADTANLEDHASPAVAARVDCALLAQWASLAPAVLASRLSAASLAHLPVPRHLAALLASHTVPHTALPLLDDADLALPAAPCTCPCACSCSDACSEGDMERALAEACGALLVAPVSLVHVCRVLVRALALARSAPVLAALSAALRRLALPALALSELSVLHVRASEAHVRPEVHAAWLLRLVRVFSALEVTASALRTALSLAPLPASAPLASDLARLGLSAPAPAAVPITESPSEADISSSSSMREDNVFHLSSLHPLSTPDLAHIAPAEAPVGHCASSVVHAESSLRGVRRVVAERVPSRPVRAPRAPPRPRPALATVAPAYAPLLPQRASPTPSPTSSARPATRRVPPVLAPAKR